jgi:hypothetical protein
VKDAGDYLTYVKALIVANPQVTDWKMLREEAQDDLGLFRCRITLRDGSLLELFERFQVVGEKLQITKYRFHWQDAAGRLVKRWDNAAHHPEISTHPHHVHDGNENNVISHGPISAEDILGIIASMSTD